jgi:hypothetical protein
LLKLHAPEETFQLEQFEGRRYTLRTVHSINLGERSEYQPMRVFQTKVTIGQLLIDSMALLGYSVVPSGKEELFYFRNPSIPPAVSQEIREFVAKDSAL